MSTYLLVKVFHVAINFKKINLIRPLVAVPISEVLIAKFSFCDVVNAQTVSNEYPV